MGRFGFRPEALPAFLDEYLSQKEMKIAGVFAHLPLSEDPAFNASQRRIFDEGLAQLSARGISPGVRHHSNSLVSILDPTLHYDMVRPGLILYGVPSHESLKKEVAVKPVMTFLTRIVSIREVPAGVGLSYGHTFRTSRNSRIATLPVGYADGYPRACGNRASVVIRGRRFPVVGRVCMDLTLVDITDDPSIVRGERVTLFGSADSGGGEVPVQEIAKIQDTIAYEILCGISPRVPRIIRRVEPGANAS
jgi:alanine racemase